MENELFRFKKCLGFQKWTKINVQFLKGKTFSEKKLLKMGCEHNRHNCIFWLQNLLRYYFFYFG